MKSDTFQSVEKIIVVSVFEYKLESTGIIWLEKWFELYNSFYSKLHPIILNAARANISKGFGVLVYP